MKKILLFAVPFAACFNLSAQLRLTEQFDNPPFTSSGDLGTQNSWIQNGSGTDVQVVYRTNNTGALTYPGYNSGRTSVSVARYSPGSSGTDPYKSFNSAIPTNVENVVFYSFVIRVSSAQNTGDYCVALRSSGGNYFGRFAVRNNGGNVNFGVETDASSFVWTGSYSYNTTYFIVIRYDNPTGNNNDDVYLWVNPSTITQPSTGSAQATISNSGDNWGGETISALALRQGGSNACAAQLDAFRVASGTGQGSLSANASAAWDNLSPAGAPLPVKLGPLTAFERNNGVQIDWTAYSEENLDKYVVERSADGSQFLPIGDVDARNVTSESKYGYFDANPLPGISFYRLRNVDIDGKTGLSNIVRVNLSKSATDLRLYPNPTTNGTISYQSTNLPKGNYSVRIFNAAGQQVYNQRMAHQGGAITQAIQLPAGLQAGLYNLRMESESTIIGTKTFMLQ